MDLHRAALILAKNALWDHSGCNDWGCDICFAIGYVRENPKPIMVDDVKVRLVKIEEIANRAAETPIEKKEPEATVVGRVKRPYTKRSKFWKKAKQP